MPTQISLGGIATYEKVRLVQAVVDEGDIGIFLNTARLVDQSLRDARVFSTLMTRIGSLLGKPRKWESAKGFGIRKDTAQRIADEMETCFPRMASHATLVELMTWVLMQGVGLAQILEDTDPWTLKVWHPWALEYREFERKYYVQTRENQTIAIESDGKGGYRTADGTRWVLLTFFDVDNAFRRSLIRALAELYLERRWTHRDRARYSEKHGKPTTVGIAPGESDKKERDEFKKDLTVGDEPTVVVRQGTEGNKWDVKYVEAMGKSHELFAGAFDQLDGEVADLILGQSQSIDGQAGLGSNPDAGEPVRLDIMKGDAEGLSCGLRTQFLMPYFEWSYGNADLAPWLCIQVEPPEDKAKKALEEKTVVETLVAAKSAGIPVDDRALLESHGMPMLTPEEAAKREADAAKLAADAAQAAAQKAPANGANNQATGANGAYGGA